MGCMEELKLLILNNENWLVKRILKYALERNFTKYTSTLEEAWRLSISGLSDSITNAIDTYGEVPELDPDDNYLNDPISQFAIIEAIKHRERGIPLEMFLALTKYYKQTYLDLILFKSVAMPQDLEKQRYYIERSFDRIEIAYTKKWSETPQDDLIQELRNKNRILANEKNKYLTVFESVSDPILLVNSKGVVVNLNHTAAKLISPACIPGGNYYAPNQIEELEELLDINMLKSARDVFIGKKLNELYPWITLHKASSYFSISSIEDKIFQNMNNNKRYKIYTSGMLDVSKKFDEIIIGLKEIEEDAGLQISKDIKHYLDYLVDEANIVLLGLDKNANVIFFNAGAEKVTGFTKEEVLNKNWFEKIVPSNKFPQVYRVFRAALEKKTTRQFYQNKIISKSGEEKTIFWKNEVNSNLLGEFAIFSVGIDITQFVQEQSDNRNKIFETIFNSIKDAVFLADSEGKMVFHNDEMISLLSPTIINGDRPNKTIADFDLDLWIDLQKLDTDQVLIKNLNLEDFSEQKFFPAELVVKKINFDMSLQYLVSIRDISERKKQDRILRESEDKFKLLYDSMTQGVLLHNSNGDIIDMNPSASDMFLLDRYKPINFNTIPDIWALKDEKKNNLEYTEYPIYRVVNTKKAIYHEEIWVENLINNRLKWVSISVIPQFQEDGEIKQIWSILEDIDDRKQWELRLINSQVQFKELFEKAPIPLFIFDMKANLLDANQVALEWYKSSKEELLALNVNLYSFPILITNKDMNIDEVFVQHKTRNWYDVLYLSADSKVIDSDRIVNVKMYPIKNIELKVDKVICFLEDVTAQNQARKKLQEINIDLEKRVEERTKELQNAKHEVEESLLQKEEYTDLQSRFINMISHEYRTPLTFISTSAAILERLLRDKDTEKASSYISKIYAAVNILNHLVDDVMKFVEVETSEIKVINRTVNLVEYLSNLINEVKILDKTSHKIKFNTERDYFSTMIDTNLLRQIVTHIMVNAMKFSPEDSAIDIRLHFSQSSIILEIEDRGVGITEKDLTYLFSPFFKSKKDIGIKSGTGLGLRLVKKLVEAMKGTIDLKSQINKGTNVILTFPSS